ncbi:DUF3231 family protein [Metallumcola ferriviriculae]|uniref:DUF3231 family protein n=1 Tax=Metallumcola ferriviriculae TaxID=3039180 RepID=A0AAU0ULG4_9FIRM|nr:DUF3231 family protein [Desulfitibacteraceae bacterium MK1]
MVQLGNIHIGNAGEAQPPSLSIQEAGYLWDFLVGRYKCLEETNIYLNIAKDPEFIVMLRTGISEILTEQAAKVEKEMEKYKLPLPKRNPKAFKNLNKKEVEVDDEFIFRQIFSGCQEYIDYLARTTRSMIINDNLRSLFAGFLKKELFFFDKLCKYGKTKGWLEVPPMYKN